LNAGVKGPNDSARERTGRFGIVTKWDTARSSPCSIRVNETNPDVENSRDRAVGKLQYTARARTHGGIRVGVVGEW
jgi:hypothetical protein